MNRIRKYAKQIFAAEANTTTSADLEPVISIDHTNRLVEGIKSLQTVLGIVDLKPIHQVCRFTRLLRSLSLRLL